MTSHTMFRIFSDHTGASVRERGVGGAVGLPLCARAAGARAHRRPRARRRRRARGQYYPQLFIYYT